MIKIENRFETKIEDFIKLDNGIIFKRGLDVWYQDEVAFVAVKSKTEGMNDWAIYCLPLRGKTIYPTFDGDWAMVADLGMKITSDKHIKAFARCDDETLKLYRR